MQKGARVVASGRPPVPSSAVTRGNGTIEQPPTSTMRSVERAFDVLAVLERSGSPLRLSEISRRARLHVATTQRILSVLASRSFVMQDHRGFQVGVAAVPAAHAYLVGSDLNRLAMPVLQELASSCGETTSLCVRLGWDRVVIGSVEGRRPLRYQLPIGERLPLHLGVGKVLAAGLGDDELAELFAQAGEVRLASGAILATDKVHQQIREVRRRGYFVSRGERARGVVAVAAPIGGFAPDMLGALVVSGLEADLPPKTVTHLTTELVRAGDAVAARCERR